MGLFDIFSKGGKYFGKAIEPKCEYCDFGSRTKDGDKVLCTKKGMVEASSHCPKFVYSPLKRIPVKQMNMVGFLEGDYDEKGEEGEEGESGAQSEGGASEGGTQTAETPKAEEKPAEEPAASAVDDLQALAAAAEAAGEYNPEEEDAAGGSDDNTLSSL